MSFCSFQILWKIMGLYTTETSVWRIVIFFSVTGVNKKLQVVDRFGSHQIARSFQLISWFRWPNVSGLFSQDLSSAYLEYCDYWSMLALNLKLCCNFIKCFLQLESLGRSELASRLTLNCLDSYVEPQKLYGIPTTIIDVSNAVV